jgi:arylsulfatase A-like enzyme
MKAIGPDLRRTALTELNSFDIAPTIADLLDIKAPRDAQGKRLNGSRDDD